MIQLKFSDLGLSLILFLEEDGCISKFIFKIFGCNISRDSYFAYHVIIIRWQVLMKCP